MKKQSLIFLCAIFLVLISCSEDRKSINQPVEENLYSSPNLHRAMELNEPDIMIEPVTYGVLVRGKTDTFANVTYIDPEKTVYYQFEKIDGLWTKNDYDSVKYHDKDALGKMTIDSQKLAKLYSGEGYSGYIGKYLIIENLEYITEDTWVNSDLYGSWINNDYKTVGSCKFIDQDDITVGYETWSISFDCWNFCYEDGTSGWSYNSDCSSTDLWQIDELAIETFLTVCVDYTNTTPLPPAPALVAPSNGATTGTTVYFNWNASTGIDVDYYKIEVKNAVTYEVVQSAEVTGTAKTFSGFSYSTPYTWQVKAHNAGGYGNWSTSRSFTVQDPPSPSITVSSIGNHQYSASASGGSGTYTSYEWWYRKDGDPLSKEPQVGVWIKNSSWDDQTTVTFDPSYDNFSLKCKVTDSNNQTAEDIYSERSLRK